MAPEAPQVNRSAAGTISIVIPAWNAARYLEETIRSVHGQDTAPMEILLADDGSEDGGGDLAEALGCTVLRQEWKGPAAARNLALARARGDLVLFLDADDLLEPHALSTLLAPLAADEGLQVAKAMALDFPSPDLSPDEVLRLRPRREPYAGLLSGCVLLRRSALEILGNFDETLTTGEGVDWLLRMGDRAVRSMQLPTVTVRRRLHRNNSGRRLRRDEYVSYAAILRRRRDGGSGPGNLQNF
ncbi:MAG: glycosyltransferase family 2 protein [Puniceicoccales bacterium]|jgi:glycosyltransferase involved in cell wall biosynthesis|nr:glycosyltransferase family 2 protein [Puniceicoccales bacterium]